MKYFQIKVTFTEAIPWKDVYTTLLADIGCESFEDGETENILLAYIPENLFDDSLVQSLFQNQNFNTDVKYSISEMEQQNWNAVWESNYEQVCIANRCYIRAPFHPKIENVEYEIVIEPKMSFGTAHHETTSMMIEYILDENLDKKSVLDMGSGTGILAILAAMRGANPVTAIDNDEWAYENALENIERNNQPQIEVLIGDAILLKGNKKYDLIIANINRNILLNDLPSYQNVLNKNGVLFLSGFYVIDDLQIITQKCIDLGLQFISNKEKNKWCAAKFIYTD